MRRTFRVKSMLSQVGPLIAVCAVIMVMLFVVFEPEAYTAVWLTGGVLLVAVLIVAWLVTRTRLEIGPEGITYHAIGYRVVGAWGDVVGYGKRVMGVHDVESLILRAPGIRMSGWMELSYQLLPAVSVLAALRGQPIATTPVERLADAIPVGMFDRDWRTGDIGALVRTYAPTAFDTVVT